MKSERSSGIILHITSLPGPYGIGDLGPEAYKFADFLAETGCRYWQLLPLNPIDEGAGFSPYSSHSAFAVNTWLISPELLVEEGLLQQQDLKKKPKFDPQKTDYKQASTFKETLLEKAHERFLIEKPEILQKKYKKFCRNQAAWLNDFALFLALKEQQQDKPWMEWPAALRDRDPDTIKEKQKELAQEIEQLKFGQFLFFEQWDALKHYCAEKGIKLFGDLPFYVSSDSADVWSHPDMFKLDKRKHPTVVSGVPPDYFSETGQLWGTPVYNWNHLKKDNYRWWFSRLAHNLLLFDVVRIDHFRAFYDFWEVPAGEETAVNGKWQSGPAYDFFDSLKSEFPDMPFIAEDLGDVHQGVYDLKEHYDLPGMLVLQYGFGEDIGTSIFAPHNHTKNNIIYTGTHDNATTKGWYKNELKPADRKRLSNYVGQEVTEQNAHDALMQLTFMSVGFLAIVPLQDLLGLGEEGLMNRPGNGNGNWTWRLQKGQLKAAHGKQLREWLQIYGRLVEKNSTTAN